MRITHCKDLREAVHQAVSRKYLFGDPTLIDLFLLAFLSRGHVLLEGPPGTGKTLTAKVLAHLLARSMRRIQFTSDMLPADIIGAHIYSPATQAFKFLPGPLFADFILADEINRTPPRTQSALLEAMEERQVTVEGERFSLSPDFFVIATQNPQDFEGTFPLPEAQTDRFLFKIQLQHGSREQEEALLQSVLEGKLPPEFGDIPVLDLDRSAIEAEIKTVIVDRSLVAYVTKILEQTRQTGSLRWGSSVRGGIALLKAARVRALLCGRSHVTPDDIKELVIPTLRHRVSLTPEAQLSNVKEPEVLQSILKKVEFPV